VCHAVIGIIQAELTHTGEVIALSLKDTKASSLDDKSAGGKAWVKGELINQDGRMSSYSKEYRNKKGHMGGLMLLFFTQFYVDTITY